MKFLKIAVVFLTILITACNRTNNIKKAETISKSIENKLAPDKRVAIYNINFKNSNTKIIISGKTNLTSAYNSLLDSLKKHKITFVDNIRVLPDSVLENKIHAVGKNSVINIRSKPKHSSELGTQGLLGMTLQVYDKQGDFYQVQTPDNYISWVDKGGIELMNTEDFEIWKQSKKVMYTKNVGFSYTEKSVSSIVISDVVFGNLFKYLSEDNQFYKVQYPDNRIGFIKKDEAVIYNQWLDNLDANSLTIETAANTFLGLPYLWGGTSTKGVDCSGFTKTVYLMNGFVIPRDASQQILAGQVVDKNLEFKNLKKGDLLFFGKKATENSKQRVTHVGIWLGNGKGEFIHASGNVHLSSINPKHQNYDAFNKNRYLGSRRYLNVKDKSIINLKDIKIKK